MPKLSSFLTILMLSVALSACSDGGNSAIGPGVDNAVHPSTPGLLIADSALAASIRATAALNGVGLDSVGLASLRELAARGIGIASLEGIGVLRNLRTLDLSENQITDLSPLEDLDSLRELDLSGNRVSDLSPIAALPQLEIVLLQGNLIRDPSPLLRLTRLTDVELKDNPLDATAQATLAALAARGVAVSTDAQPSAETGTTLPGALAFTDFGSGIFIASSAETGPIPLIAEPAQYGYLTWSPDGTILAFAAKLTGDSVPRIYLIPRTGGQAVRATAATGTAAENDPCWSPSGDRIAFVRSERDTAAGGWYLHDAYLLTVANRAEQRLTTDGTVANIHWNPTEEMLVIQHTDMRTVSLLDPRDGTQAFLARGADRIDNQHPWGLGPVAWSVDGTNLLLTGIPESASTYGIYVYRPPASPELVVANTDSLYNQFPAWSPDGTRFVYQRLVLVEKKGKFSTYRQELAICTLPARTVEAIPNTSSFTPGESQWSPDGTMIAFTGKSPGSDYRAVFVVSLTDFSITQLTNVSTPGPGELAWAPR